MRSLTSYIAPEVEYLNAEATRDVALEDALTLTPDERSDIDEQTRIVAEQAMIEAAGENSLESYLDYLFADDHRAFDKEPF